MCNVLHAECARFQRKEDRDLAHLIEESVPKETKMKAAWAHRVFQEWTAWRLSTSGDAQCDRILRDNNSPLNADNSDLDVILSNFISEVRNKKGGDYPAKTKHEIITSIQKYMEINCRKRRLLDAETFPMLYYALDVSMKESSRQGLGMKAKAAAEISYNQEETLWNKNVLGKDDPKSLQRAVFFVIGVQFGIRGGREHRNLTIDNFRFLTDGDGHEYLEYQECITKTNQGGIKHRKVERHSARAYAQPGNDRCPLSLVSKYISLCPMENLRSSFYLKPLQKPKADQWYGKQPVGHNMLSAMVSNMMKDAGITGNFTNHSLRVTTVTRLFQNNVDTKLITKQTGHRSDAVERYKRISDVQRMEVSSLLCSTSVETSKMKEDNEDEQPESSRPNCDIPENLKDTTVDGKPFIFNISGNNNTFHIATCSSINK